MQNLTSQRVLGCSGLIYRELGRLGTSGGTPDATTFYKSKPDDFAGRLHLHTNSADRYKGVIRNENVGYSVDTHNHGPSDTDYGAADRIDSPNPYDVVIDAKNIYFHNKDKTETITVSKSKL